MQVDIVRTIELVMSCLQKLGACSADGDGLVRLRFTFAAPATAAPWRSTRQQISDQKRVCRDEIAGRSHDSAGKSSFDPSSCLYRGVISGADIGTIVQRIVGREEPLTSPLIARAGHIAVWMPAFVEWKR
jgi:hypothetical protein